MGSIYGTGKNINQAIKTGHEAFSKKEDPEIYIPQKIMTKMFKSMKPGDSWQDKVDEYAKNKKTKYDKERAVLEAQAKRLGLEHVITPPAPPSNSIKAIKTGMGFVAAGAIPIIQSELSHYFTMQGMKSRDVTKQNRIKEQMDIVSDGSSVLNSTISGFAAGAPFGPGGAAAGALLGMGISVATKSVRVNNESDKMNEKIRQSTIEADINSIVLGEISSNGNRGGLN